MQSSDLHVCCQAADPGLRDIIRAASSRQAGASAEGDGTDEWELWPMLLGLLLQGSAWSTVTYNSVNGSLNGRLSGLAIAVPALAEAVAQVSEASLGCFTAFTVTLNAEIPMQLHGHLLHRSFHQQTFKFDVLWTSIIILKTAY